MWCLFGRDSNDFCGFFVVDVLTNRFLLDVANKTGNKYYEIAVRLDVDMPVIKRIEMEHRHDTVRLMHELLIYWRDNSPMQNDARMLLNKLSNTFTQSGHVDIVEWIQRCEIIQSRSRKMISQKVVGKQHVVMYTLLWLICWDLGVDVNTWKEFQ